MNTVQVLLTVRSGPIVCMGRIISLPIRIAREVETGCEPAQLRRQPSRSVGHIGIPPKGCMAASYIYNVACAEAVGI